MGNICQGSHVEHLYQPGHTPPALSNFRSESLKSKNARHSRPRSHGCVPDTIYLNISDYHQFAFVYEGRFGTVFSAVQVNGNDMVALKCFGYSSSVPQEESLQQEITVLTAMKGIDGIVQIQGIITDPPHGLLPGKKIAFEYPILVTEFLGGGDISDWMCRNRVVSEKEISEIFRHIILGLDGLHSKRFIHRDLKLENLMFSSHAEGATVKIVDMGSAVRVSPRSSDGVYRDSSVVGTVGYLAPESIQYYDYSSASDIWQAGCVLYSMLSGMFAFSPQDTEQTTRRSYFKMEGMGWENISLDAKRLVKCLLQRNPKYRITIEQILSHPWMTNKLPGVHLGSEYLTRFKHLALRQQMKTFLRDHKIDLGETTAEASRRIDSIIPAFTRQSSSLRTTEGTPSPAPGLRVSSDSRELKNVRSWSTDPPLPTAETTGTDRRQLSSPQFRREAAALSATLNSSHEYDSSDSDDPFLFESFESLSVPDQFCSTRIDYATFESILQSSDLPQLATPQVFRMFDKEEKGFVDLKDFLLTMLAFRDVDSPIPYCGDNCVGPLSRGNCLSDQDDPTVDTDFVHAFQKSVELFFDIFDLHRTGFVQLNDLKVAVGSYFLDMANPIYTSHLYVHAMTRIEDLLRNIVVTSDGRISHEEFQQFYISLLRTYSHSGSVQGQTEVLLPSEETKTTGVLEDLTN